MKKNILVRLSVVLLAAALLLSLVSCGSTSVKNAEKYDEAAVAYSEEAEFYGMSADSGATYNKLSAEEALPKTANDLSARKIIRNATVNFETKEYDEFLAGLNACIAANGGYVESSDSSAGGIYYSRSRHITLTVRVPAERYDSFMSEAGAMGTMTSKTENSSEVTMEYVDTESRIKALRTEYDALIALMDKAETLDDVILLQSRITDLTYEIESYESRLRTYDDLISYCTIRIYVSEVLKETVPEDTMTVGERISTGFSESMEEVGEGFSDFAVWFVVNLPFILIWAVVILAVILIIRGIVKHSRKKREKKNVEQYLKTVGGASQNVQKTAAASEKKE